MQLTEEKSRIKSLNSQNEELRTKNMQLMQEIEALSKRRGATITNDSITKTKISREYMPDIDSSLENQVSPLQKNHKLYEN